MRLFQPVPKAVDTMHLRDFNDSDADYRALVELENQTWPDTPTTVEAQREMVAARPDIRWDQRVCEIDGSVAGLGSCGAAFWLGEPGAFHVYVVVNHAHRRQGIGSHIFRDLLKRMPPADMQTLNSGCREDQIGGLKFLQAHGFVETGRDADAELDLAEFDIVRLAETCKDPSPARFRPLAPLTEDCPDWMERFRDLAYRIQAEAVAPEILEKPSAQQFAEEHLNARDFNPYLCWIARDGTDWIGLTELRSMADDDTAVEAFRTGVDPARRGRGVATALKLHAFASAKAQGYAKVVAHGDPDSSIGHIHRRLGFQFQPAWIGMQKPLQPPNP
ncbi:MAG: GNAT family N-acetyltransferase [Caldilineaceae bacterium]|nr:GNAT family N-acetyltransferase [Caldilineaceae bacterium]